MRRTCWASLSVVSMFAVSFGVGLGDPALDPRPVSAAACPVGGEPVELDSVAQVDGLLVGTWIRCEGQPVPGSPVDDVGIELTADGQWHRLYRADDGSLVRTSGVGQEGTFGVTDLTEMNGPGSYQVDFSILGGGLVPVIVEFTTAPDAMSFELEPATYVRDPAASAVDGVVPGLDTGCGHLDDQVVLPPDELAAALAGAWVRCSGAPLFGGEEVGLEFLADGAFHFLYDDGEGGLIRASGVEQEGIWAFVDGQLNLELLGAGIRATFPEIYDSPARTLRLNEIEPLDLRRWDGPAPTPGPAPNASGCALDDPIPVASQEEAARLLVGTWIPCLGAGGPDGQVGIEFAADGRFNRVYRDPDGGLVRADGLDQEGLWRFGGEEGAGYGLNLRLSGRGSFGVAPLFFESPQSAMWLSYGTTFFPAGGYLRWTGDPPQPGPPPGPVPTCGHFREPVSLTSAEQASTRLVGAWTLCDPGSVLGVPAPGEVGIEFLADGSFHLLIRQPDGTVAKGSGPGHIGTWTNVGMTAPGTVQIDLTVEGGLVRQIEPRFFDDPDSVYFRIGGPGIRYIRGVPAAITPPTIPATGTTPVPWILAAAGLFLAGGGFASAAARRRSR